MLRNQLPVGAALLMVLGLALTGCASPGAPYSHQQTDAARAEAERLGHSGPLYDHYQGCLNTHWEQALDAGQRAGDAYESGVEQCRYSRVSLCDYYAVSSCQLDAEASTRVLFFLLRESYVRNLNQ